MSYNESSYEEDNTQAQAIFVFILLPICFLIYGCCKTIKNFYLDDEDFISSSEYEPESDQDSELELEENSTRELKPDYDSADSDESKYQ